MRVLIIGLGSIAQKHIKVLKEICDSLEILALRSKKGSIILNNVKNIYSWNEIPNNLDFIIISNPTSEHFSTIKNSLRFKVPLFIEKPPLSELNNSQELLNLINENNIPTYVGFNLRFHPIIFWLKKNLQLNKIREVNVYCGSYLPEWRKGIDYRQCYSAKKELGGDVHLDLIHELDYTRWLFGDPINIKSTRSKKSDLEINSFDFANYLLEYENYYVNITLNYYRRDTKRTIEIILENETWVADLINCSVIDSNNNIIFNYNNFKIIQTYFDQMQYFLKNIKTNKNIMNNFEESLKTLKICLG